MTTCCRSLTTSRHRSGLSTTTSGDAAARSGPASARRSHRVRGRRSRSRPGLDRLQRRRAARALVGRAAGVGVRDAASGPRVARDPDEYGARVAVVARLALRQELRSRRKTPDQRERIGQLTAEPAYRRGELAADAEYHRIHFGGTLRATRSAGGSRRQAAALVHARGDRRRAGDRGVALQRDVVTRGIRPGPVLRNLHTPTLIIHGRDDLSRSRPRANSPPRSRMRPCKCSMAGTSPTSTSASGSWRRSPSSWDRTERALDAATEPRAARQPLIVLPGVFTQCALRCGDGRHRRGRALVPP